MKTDWLKVMHKVMGYASIWNSTTPNIRRRIENKVIGINNESLWDGTWRNIAEDLKDEN